MTTREQAVAAFDRLSRHFVIVGGRAESSPYLGSDTQDQITNDWLAIRSYLAQPEGGDVEEALARMEGLCFSMADWWGGDVTEDGVRRDVALLRSALRSAKEREAAAVERTVEKAKDVVLAYSDCYQPTEKILAALDSLKEKDDA